MVFDELREDYQGPSFGKEDCETDPCTQFQKWFDDALRNRIAMANAMTLATVGREGAPHARIVLLKELDSRGFVFYTNYDSRKAEELTGCNRAALVFYWHAMHRQIRVEGEVHKVSAAESDTYFASRSRASNLVAISSSQSREVGSRSELLHAIEGVRVAAGDGPIERPPNWGGYRLRPTQMEFWQGRPDRSHDRIQYQRDGDGNWRVCRLFP